MSLGVRLSVSCSLTKQCFFQRCICRLVAQPHFEQGRGKVGPCHHTGVLIVAQQGDAGAGKVEINDIISRIRNDNNGIDFRLGSVFYRDEGDEYVTRTSSLSGDFGQVADFINSQRADGGGDYPEAVHSALRKAIGEQAWQEGARARLLFLILDAPPHHQDDVIQAMQDQLLLAAQKGIKIIPVTASGIDKETEFLMRILAIASNGTYTFITDHSGIGNDHLERTIGDYEVEFLNDLIVRLVGKYVD